MDQKTIIVGSLMLLVGLGVGFAAQDSDGYGHRWKNERGGHMMENNSMMSQNIDQHFIAQMIPHHEGAIEMAKIALERSKRPEIISLAKMIIAAQTKEINDMTGWYKEWFGLALPEGGIGQGQGGSKMHMGGMTGNLDDLTAVSNAEFDREFITQMIPHHEMAIMMASMLVGATERDEMKILANNIISSQSHEIDEMAGWLEAWYGN